MLLIAIAATAQTPTPAGKTTDSTQVKDTVRVQDLSAVTVTTKKPLLEKRADRTIVNVEAMVTAAGTDAYQLLENVPGVTVDDDGNVSLNGRGGVLVIINGKQTYLSGTGLVNYLRSLPSSSLEKIELMPVPPAGFDAAGSAGVINIVTKKLKKRGLNGNLNAAMNQGILFSTNNSLMLNYQVGKFNWFGTGSFVTQNRLTDLDINRSYHDAAGRPDFTFFQNSYIRRTGETAGFRGGVDYDINPKTILGVAVNLLHQPSDQRTTNRSEIARPGQQPDSVVLAANGEKDRWQHQAVNLNFRKTLPGKGHSFGADADYLHYKSAVIQGFDNTTERSNGTKVKEYLQGWLPSQVHIWAAKADYARMLSSLVLEAGVKSSYAHTKNVAAFSLSNGHDTVPDYDKSNDFTYKEYINAAYMSVQRSAARWSVKAGLRAEHTTSQGYQAGNPVKPDSAFRRNYTNLFPTFFASYSADSAGKHQFTLSYARRIERPFYQDLNPYVSPLDKFTLYVGNPFLNPSFTHHVSLAYTFRRNWTASMSYSLVEQVFMEAILLDGPHYLSRTENLGKNQLFTVSINGSISPRPWWTANIYVEGGDRRYRGKLFHAAMDTSAWYIGTSITQQFMLGKDWVAELSGNWRTSVLVGQVSLGAIGQLNAGIQKKVLKKQGTIRLSVRDVFYSAIRNGEIHFLPQAQALFRNRADSRIATLSFSWAFGKSNQQARPRSSGSATDEQNRVRQ